MIENIGKLKKPFFDWYSVTFYEFQERKPEDIGNFLGQIEKSFFNFYAMACHWVKVEKGRNGYPLHARLVNEETGEFIMTACYGSLEMPPNVFASGETAQLWYQLCSLNLFGRFWVARADVAYDTTTIPFDKLIDFGRWFSRKKNLKTSVVGDWDRAQDGRTYYIGSRSSVAYLRIYEKGIQTKTDPNWIRVEFEFKPHKDFRKRAASLSPEEMMSGSLWATDFLGRFGIELEHYKHRTKADLTPSTVVANIIKKHRRIIAKAIKEDFGGDVQAFNEFLHRERLRPQ